MTRALGLLVCVTALVACDRMNETPPGEQRGDLAQEQAQEQAELATEQAQERARLEQELAEQQAEAREEAQEDLAEQTAETQEQRQEAAEETQRLNQLIEQACTGITTAQQDVCPIERGHASTSNIDDGVALRLDAQTRTTEVFQHRVDCYRAIRAARGAPVNPAYACVLDVPDVDVDVNERNGHVVVELTSDQPARVEELRNGVRVYATTPRVN
jgi:hypothetical protein